MIILKDFYKNYYNHSHKETAFSVGPIDISISDSTIAGLLGPNGSGKTTIMKAICGFHYPSSGTILISDNNGNFFDTSKNPEKIMELVGYVPEQSILPKEMTVYDFLNYAADLHGLKNKNQAIVDVIKKCSLEKVIEKKIKTLSKGYHQRVSFAQAIIHNPKNLVLDEPVSGLDPSQIIQMRKMIKDMAKDKSILLSTHLLQEVYSLCDTVCIISEGELVAKGTENEIIAQTKAQNLEEAFIKLTPGESDQ
ncbi:MAG: ABC transporter ATP-binding protein [Treponema sp.]|nr:ABC transporter ATP-binding protein [Treponema sp.]